jgi:hypothetical protein
MKNKVMFAMVLICLSASAAQAMDAESFYAKALTLKKQGMSAMFSKDLKPVMSEFQNAAKSVKAENDKAKVAGNPIYCAPAKPQKMTTDQFLAEFGKIPQSRRQQMTVRQAWREIVIRKYPC